MRGVYTLKTLSLNGTAPLFLKLIRTFSAVAIVLFVVVFICFTLRLATHLGQPELVYTVRLFLVCVGAYGLSLLAVLGVLSRSAVRPLNELIELVNTADSLEATAFSDHTSSEIVEVHRILNSMLERLRVAQAELISSERMAAVGKTTQMLAHDVRKPFSMLKMALDVMDSTSDPEGLRRLAGMLRPEVSRAMVSVEGMLADIIELGGKHDPRLEAVTPQSLVSSTLNEIFRVRKSAQVELSYSLEHTRKVSVDTGRVLRVFANLVDNAVDAMGGKGAIWFRTRDAGEFVEFCVGNANSYIEPEDRARIFDPFFTKGKDGGTGLGLAIVQKIVQAHRGKIRCESSFGKGTEFYFTLPSAPESCNVRADLVGSLPTTSREIVESFARIMTTSRQERGPEYAEDKVAEYRARVVSAAKRAGRKLKISMIDDEPVYLNGLAMLISRDRELAELCELHPARAIDDGVAIADRVRPDLIICDIDMGEVESDGFDAVARIRRLDIPAQICVHSNRSLPTDYARAIGAGANAFLPKPLSRAHLLGLMAHAVGTWKQESES